MDENARERRHAVYVPMRQPVRGSQVGKMTAQDVLARLSTPQMLALARTLEKAAPATKGKNQPILGISKTARPSPDARAELAKDLEGKWGQVVEVARVLPAVAVSQVGFVFYEKLLFEPVGTFPSEEVLKRVFLGPSGEVELTKKTWSKVETEFSEATDMVSSEERETSLSANRELSESTASQRQFSASMGSSVQASGTVGVYQVSGKAEVNLQAARQRTEQDTVKELKSLTAKAAARVKQEHKISYMQRTQFSSESMTVEKLRNPNTTHAVTVTLRKLLQRWRVRHLQYGVRLCVDVMVRNPGLHLRSTCLSETFDPSLLPEPDPGSPPTGAPPVPPREIIEEKELTFGSGKASKAVAFAIPEGYELEFMTAVGEDGRQVTFSELPGQPGFISGAQAGLRYIEGRYLGHHVNNYTGGETHPPVRSVTVTAHFRRTEALLGIWKSAARAAQAEEARRRFDSIRMAADAERRGRDAERSLPPAQVLRKEERDELLAAVSRFLLTGDDVPEPGSGEQPPADPHSIRQLSDWLEWEAMSSFLYPYWWDPTVHADLTEGPFTLDHPDFQRREFVRSSWARVLIPVRIVHQHDLLTFFFGSDEEGPPGDLLAAADQIAAEETLLAAEPREVASWEELTPLNETCEEMDLLRDSEGIPVDIAEPILRRTQATKAESAEALLSAAKTMANRVDEEHPTAIVVDGGRIFVGENGRGHGRDD